MENKIVLQNTVTWGENDSPMLGEQERHFGWSQRTSWRGDLPFSAVYTLCLLWTGVTLRISHSSPHFTHHPAPAHTNCSRSYHQWVLGLSLIGLCRHHDALYLRKASWTPDMYLPTWELIYTVDIGGDDLVVLEAAWCTVKICYILDDNKDMYQEDVVSWSLCNSMLGSFYQKMVQCAHSRMAGGGAGTE